MENTRSNIALLQSFKAKHNIPETTTLNSYNKWKQQGYQVKKGEHAKYKAFLWSALPKPDSRGRTHRLRPVYLFDDSQVTKI